MIRVPLIIVIVVITLIFAIVICFRNLLHTDSRIEELISVATGASLIYFIKVLVDVAMEMPDL